MLAFYTAFFRKNYNVTFDPSSPPMSSIPLKNNLVKIPGSFRVRMTL
jgi:hypothetical protein